MNIFVILIGFIVMCGVVWVTLYYTIGCRPIVIDLNDPEYQVMEHYDTYEEWCNDYRKGRG